MGARTGCECIRQIAPPTWAIANMSTRRPPSRPTPKTVRKGLLGKIPRGATGLGAIAAVNALAGFAREATLAYYFGASEEIDTFLVAFTIPRMLVEQAAQTVVFVILPLYVTARENGRHDEATLLLHKWFWFLAKAVGVACIVLVFFAYPIVSLVGQGLSPAAKVSAAWWLAQLAPYVWLSILASSFKVVLDANRHFVVPASARIIVTIAVIQVFAVSLNKSPFPLPVPASYSPARSSAGSRWRSTGPSRRASLRAASPLSTMERRSPRFLTR